MLYIRADMNERIATGHMMRCLSIADAARQLGEQTTFLVADEQAVELLAKRGYDYVVLNTRWDDADCELVAMKQVIEAYAITDILIDSYQVTQNYFEELSKYVRVIYLDDLNMFPYAVAELICYANYWEKFGYCERYKETELRLGTKYAPLREAFWNCGKKQMNESVETLLILSGGTDLYDAITQILAGIERTKFKRIDVICGVYNARYEMLQEIYGQEKNIFIHRTVDNIEDYMKAADVAISAGGITLYELCACGTPTISYAFADNQLENVRKFEEDNMMDYAGDIRSDNVIDKINYYLGAYCLNRELRKERSIRMQQLVDGKGALRIAKILMNEEETDK